MSLDYLRELIKPSNPELRITSWEQLALKGFEPENCGSRDYMVKSVDGRVEIYYHLSPDGDYVYRGSYNLRREK